MNGEATFRYFSFHSVAKQNIIIFLSIVLSGALLWIIGLIFGFPINLELYFKWQITAGTLTIVLVFWGLCIGSLIRYRPQKPTAFIIDRIWNVWCLPELFLRGLPIYVLAAFPLSIFTSYKKSITKIIPFYADPWLADLDYTLHGMDPWRLFHPLAGYPVITIAIDFAYGLWFPYMFITFVVAVFLVKSARSRSQYLSAFFLSWSLVGGLTATVFSSAGPCYYDYFFGVSRFQELMNYLHDVSANHTILALETQSRVLEQFTKVELVPAEGISAFPSMHVGIAVLNALFWQRQNRYTGIAAWIFAAIIEIGSVHLAWHYAVDGYAAAILILAIWWVCGWLSRRYVQESFTTAPISIAAHTA